MKIAINIKTHLQNENLSLADFAKSLELPLSTIHGWLNGVTPKNIYDIKKVADSLGVTIEELCFNEKINVSKKTNVKVLIDDQAFELILKRI